MLLQAFSYAILAQYYVAVDKVSTNKKCRTVPVRQPSFWLKFYQSQIRKKVDYVPVMDVICDRSA